MNYHKIDTCNMNNGDGLRVVVWVSGCRHHCEGCFNPETWDYLSGDILGKEQMEMIENALSQDWCKGITLTGGDPLAYENLPNTYDIVSKIKRDFPTKDIWIYTGNTFENINRAPMGWDKGGLEGHIVDNFCDVLVDGEFDKNISSPDKHWVGSYNQRVIDVKESLATGKVVIHE